MFTALSFILVSSIASSSFQVILFPSAFGQQQDNGDITINTSADKHGMKFFGEGVVQIVITDENSDDNRDDSIPVRIDAKSDDGSRVSDTFQIPNTSSGSQKFEFFLVHAGSQYADGVGTTTQLDPVNTAGFDSLSDGFDGKGAPLIRFGNDAGSGVELDTGGPLYEDASLDISYGDEAVTVDYEETSGLVDTDRESYGTDSFVYISINDNDANLNPFEQDSFTVDPSSGPNMDLFNLDGGTFEGAVVFEETGDNTGMFKGKYQLGDSIQASSESLALTLNDKANYGRDLGAPENDSNNADQVNFFIGNTDGQIIVDNNQQGDNGHVQTEDPVFSSDKELYNTKDKVNITIKDSDANLDPAATDSIEVSVYSGSNSNDTEKFVAFETDNNTGVFAFSFFLTPTDNDTGVVVKGSDNVTIKYTDIRPASYYSESNDDGNKDKDFFFTIDVRDEDGDGRQPLGISQPIIIEESGGLTEDIVNQKVILSTIVTNDNDQIQPFTAIVEVRDSNNITTLLTFTNGTVNAHSRIEVGVQWIPQNAGDYHIRAFAVSDMDNPQVLSKVEETEITIK